LADILLESNGSLISKTKCIKQVRAYPPEDEEVLAAIFYRNLPFTRGWVVAGN
jgi:hypothetical protein